MTKGSPFHACLPRWVHVLPALVVLAILAPAARAQTLTTLYSFCSLASCADGAGLYGGLVQGTNGDFYGTTDLGGSTLGGGNGSGTAFKMTARGAVTTVHTFCVVQYCTDSASPNAGLIQATNGDFYGTTLYGGTHGWGTIFKMTPSGAMTTLYSFCGQPSCTDGASPYAGLVQGSDGNFYGTTAYGGTNLSSGTVFKITPGGTLTTLYNFCAQAFCVDGALPFAGLIQAANGDFYGTTTGGGYTGGTVFKLTPSGTLTTLYTFCALANCTDGDGPYAPLLQASDGNFYGTTKRGGPAGRGIAFRMTPGGAVTTVYGFCSLSSCTDGAFPAAGLIQANDGDFYGTTSEGGNANDAGTVFRLTSGGTLATLHTFCSLASCTDGATPDTPLLQATNGQIYGTTFAGGKSNGGTAFSLNAGLGPFVALQTSSGKVGAKVTILGTGLTGTSSVTFHGTSATFTVNSTGSAITTHVPAGATTGTVQVVTPTATLDSNVPYRVK